MMTNTSIPKKRDYAKSSSFQMALLFTVLCGGAVLVMGYFIYYFYKGHFAGATEQIIETEIWHLEQWEKTGQLPQALAQLKENPSRLYAFFHNKNDRPKFLPDNISILSEGIIVFKHKDRDKTYAAKIHSFENGQKLLVGIDITLLSKDFDFMQRLSLVSIVLMVTVIIVSYLISTFVVEGTNKIAQTAIHIMKTGDLSQRLDVRGEWDDLSNMAVALNSLLQRIEHLMQGVRQVSDNIAHDLRTPLTRLRNKCEDLLEHHQKYDDETKQNMYQDLLSEADHLLETFSALLRISRIETEQQKSQFQKLALDQIILDVIEFYEPIADERNLIIKHDLSSYERAGDRDLLFQSFANILDNAIKFTPTGGEIDISMQRNGDQNEIRFRDTGKGIPVNELEKVFDRFYRTDASRHTPGSGLGLSLVQAVVSLHNGQITLQNEPEGFVVIITL